MRKIMLALAIVAFSAVADGAEYKYRFQSMRLSEALALVADEHPGLQLNFIYNDLDKYHTAAEVDTDNPYEALRRIVGHNPVSVVREGDTYFLEALQRGKFRYTGSAVDPDGDAVPGATVMVLSPNDSTVLTFSTTDADGNFDIPCDRKKVLMKFGAAGYMTTFVNHPDFTVGRVILKQKPIALRSVAVEADQAVFQDDKNIYVPSLQQKKASQDAIDLLRRMAIPQLVINPADNAVKDVFGKPVAIFLNGQSADSNELQGLKLTDVRKVEYLEAPTDPHFNGEPRVLNIIVAEYRHGGYTKVSENVSFLNGFKNNSSVFSKFTFKKMTYDLFAGSMNTDYHHSGWDYIEEYHIEADGQPVVAEREEKLKSSRSRSNDFPITLRASYAQPKFTTRNSVSFSHFSAPELNAEGELNMPLQPDRNYNYSRSNPNQNNNIQYRGEFWGLVLPNLSIAVNPTFNHTHRNNTSIYASAVLTEAINNSVRENTYHYGVNATGMLGVGTKSQFTMAVHCSLFHHNLAYYGSQNIEDEYSNGLLAATAGYRFRAKSLSLRITTGLEYSRNEINGKLISDVSPNFGTMVNWTLNKRNQISASVNLQNYYPGIDWRVDDVVQSNEYLFLTANPYLKSWNRLNTNLAYNWNRSNALGGAVFGGYNQDFNRVTPIYVPYNEGTAVLRTYENNGNFINYYCGAQVNYKLLGNALQFSANATQNFYHSTGVYRKTMSAFRLQLQAAYYWKAFNAVASYGNPQRLLTENSNVVIRRPSFHYVALGWGNGMWTVQLSARNLFRSSWRASTWQRYAPLYSEIRHEYDPSVHRCVMVSATYTIGYGKKIQRGDEVGAQEGTPSAILER